MQRNATTNTMMKTSGSDLLSTGSGEAGDDSRLYKTVGRSTTDNVRNPRWSRLSNNQSEVPAKEFGPSCEGDMHDFLGAPALTWQPCSKLCAKPQVKQNKEPHTQLNEWKYLTWCFIQVVTISNGNHISSSSHLIGYTSLHLIRQRLLLIRSMHDTRIGVASWMYLAVYRLLFSERQSTLEAKVGGRKTSYVNIASRTLGMTMM